MVDVELAVTNDGNGDCRFLPCIDRVAIDCQPEESQPRFLKILVMFVFVGSLVFEGPFR
jgi:hypothetical protein